MDRDAVRESLGRCVRRSLIVAIAAGALAIVGFFVDRQALAESFLIGVLFCTGVSLGALGILSLHHLTGGPWGYPIRPILEPMAEGLLACALGFVPVLLNLDATYVWAHGDERAHWPAFKAAYLSPGSFTLRTAVYFVLWLALTLFLATRSRPQPGRAIYTEPDRRQPLAVVGMISVVLGGTFAAVDWIMSLDPHWFSTGFGLYVLVGFAQSAFVLATIMTYALATAGEETSDVPPQAVRDLGNLTLVFVMVWAYLGFAQYLIIWSGNMTDDIGWFIPRQRGFWGILALALILLQFFLPFLLLFSGRFKQNFGALAKLAGFLLVMRFVEMLWLVVPSLHREGRTLHWLDAVVPLAFGALWFAFFSWRLRERLEIVAVGVPRAESAGLPTGAGVPRHA